MPNPPIVRLDRVDVDIDGQTILQAIDLGIHADHHYGIVGTNGSGKSTLLALIAGTRWPAPGRGRRVYDFGSGPEGDAITARQRITLLGHELQDLYFARGWNFRVRDIVLSGFTRTDIPQRRPTRSHIEQSRALLARTGLAHLTERRLLSLSRGEQRRVLITRALAMEPALLLLDEPASGLDPEARAELDALLAEVAATTPLVIATHRRQELPALVTDIVEIRSGRLDAADETPSSTTATVSVASAPAAPSAGFRRPAGGSSRAPQATAAAAATPMAKEMPNATELIALEQVDAWLDGRPVLQAINWTIRAGEHWLITGPNGAGKSTLLKLLHADIRPARGGVIRWPGLGDPRNVWALRRRIALVSAELQARYLYPTTVAEAIGSGFSASIGAIRPLDPHERERVDALIGIFELGALANRRLSSLSYGQRHRTLIARTLAPGPRVLLLDEPWEGLDPDNAGIVCQALSNCAADGTQLICVSHVGAGGLPLNRALRLEAGRRVSAGDSAGPRESSASAQHRAADSRPR